MLRGLTERPNVQSTLILSRRDGSIIRATGVGPQEEQSSSASGKSHQWPQQARAPGQEPEAPERDGAAAASTADESTDAQQTAKPAEVLAASIFHFVNNANVLADTLGNTSRNGARTEGTFATFGDEEAINASGKGGKFEEDVESIPADEVQLLRLRTKHQEIIVFPDPNYICCVVQRVGKAGASHERR